MSGRNAAGDTPDHAGVRTRRSPVVIALAVLLYAETVALAAAALYLLFELVSVRPSSYGSAIAILVLTALAAVWLGIVAANVLRGRSWVRAAAIVWQVLQIGLGIGSLQGIPARADIGWLLIIPAAVVIALLFAHPVIAATTRNQDASGSGLPKPPHDHDEYPG
jgi:hypothetical protein